MMEEFKKLLAKKKGEQQGKPMDEHKMKAKADMAKELSDMLGSDLTNDMKSGMKKVTIASDSTQGLKEGLDKAEDIIDPSEESEEESEDSSEEESEDSDEMMASDSSSMQDKIAELEKQLEELKSKRA
jgi:ubiquinone biosynthesis protein UbiJ